MGSTLTCHIFALRLGLIILTTQIHLMICAPTEKAKNLTAEKDDIWLEDYETPDSKNWKELMQADSPKLKDQFSPYTDQLQTTSQCPPPPVEVPSFACHVLVCSGDLDCHNNNNNNNNSSSSSSSTMKCCYNGCRFTCMTAVVPPYYVDWKNKPYSRFKTGGAWLMTGAETNEQAESCTTTTKNTSDDDDDDEPLLCPTGYECHLEENSEQGHCIPAKSSSHEITEMDLLKLLADASICVHQNKIYASGAALTHNNHSCKCEHGSVECYVSEKQSI